MKVLNMANNNVMLDYWSLIERIPLDNETNLLSYITLKGINLLMIKLKGDESNYTKKKRELLEEVCKYSKCMEPNRINEIRNQVKNALLLNGYAVKVCKIKTSSRGLVGSGEPFGRVPFEVGLFFDSIYNIPFIPGSSLKGAFRHALEALLEKSGKDKSDAKKIAAEVFGSQEQSGIVGVTDAYPVSPGVNGLLFEPDVVTPHYPGSETELDVSPNPVPFLTIARDVVFEFYIYFNKAIYREESRRLGNRARRKVAELGTVRSLSADRLEGGPVRGALFEGDLAEAVKRLKAMNISVVDVIPWVDRAILYAFARGVGAKTSLGYSRFGVLEYRSVEG